MAIRIVCSWCGSDDVSRDAWANWDVKRQEWVLRQAFDDGFCHACEQARELEMEAADLTQELAVSAATTES